MSGQEEPIVLITGGAGNIGGALGAALRRRYRVVGMDRQGAKADFPLVSIDLTDDGSVAQAFRAFREQYGEQIASVIHLAAYFDFTGEEKALYQAVNVEGTRRLLRALQGFEVEQFVYSGTMLVHQPCHPGERIDEDRAIAPKWAYPRSKAAAEAVIRQEHGDIPIVLLHLAGLYDARTAVPTLAEQIARIYERDLQSHLYSGDPRVGQSMLHKADMIDAFRRTVDRRADLPPEVTILIGEPDAMGYGEVQNTVGQLIHGQADWMTLRVPKPVATAGAWAQEKLEPVVPDAIDQGEKPFIRPFMVGMADDHYALDIRRARDLLGWEPRHRLSDELPKLIDALKADPPGWYEANGVTPPPWLGAAEEVGEHPEALRTRHREHHRDAHRRHRWAHFANVLLGVWLLTSPPLIGLEGPLAWSDVIAGCTLVGLATAALSERHPWARWAAAAVGAWLMCAPFLFWTTNAAAYLNDTLVGALVFAFAFCTPPEPGVSPIAATTGPAVPPGWDYNPSSWTQRLPIIALAVVGLVVSRYLAAYQLGHIGTVWEPFFSGGPNPKSGAEEIITSEVSEAWPVSDAAVGALTYALEILTGIVGSRSRWRTMPWLVLLFGLMIAPLGVVSISFIVIQPIVIGTWCTLCLIAAAAMLVQIPYSLDELLATVQFLARRKRAGQSILRILFVGDTDEGVEGRRARDEFARPPLAVLREMTAGGVSLPWTLAACAAIGAWLMFTRVTLGAGGAMADADHLIGALVLTATAIACAEVARPARFLNAVFGAALFVTPLAYGADAMGLAASWACGAALIALSLPRGRIAHAYAGWEARLI